MPRAKQPDQAEAKETVVVAAAPIAPINGSAPSPAEGPEAGAPAKKAPASKSTSTKGARDEAKGHKSEHKTEEAKAAKGDDAAPAGEAPPAAPATHAITATAPATDAIAAVEPVGAAPADKAKAARPARGQKAPTGHESPLTRADQAQGAVAADGHSAEAPEVDHAHELFLAHQRELLLAERNNYTRQAEELRAQAEALALEHEPGDVQFDEEGGEGGTANVDRELDLHLSAQAHAAVEEIDAALDKISAGTYGTCENCGTPIPKARLEALPHARLCVSCKSGGLTARRQ
ncbi:MAG TPA: TraR/DksA C4-type zinc finger protein [Acidimicrobiales bacterium]|nr:TraR/DksA C4-type zinc finger protein [Acidimicrobiales bacterium]